MKYEKLFSPGTIGNVKLKNRVVQTAMGTCLASASGEASDDLIRFYEERAKGGVGLIITETACIDREHGIGMSVEIHADKFDYIPRLERMVNTVHKYGTKIFLDLHHPGRQGVPDMNNGYSIAPSAVALNSSILQSVPKEMTIEEIHKCRDQFIYGGMIAKLAGFDGLELHGGHGYLLEQFMSPDSNRRTDEYGGDFEGRMRFVKEIVEGIKEINGKDFPICVRISADEMTENGYGLDYGVEIAKYLEKIGVDALNVSNGTYESDYTIMEPRSYDSGWKKHLGRAVKEAVNIPVIAVDVVKKPDFAEKMLDEGNCDFVGVARAHLADPEWCNKSRTGRENEIRPCIGCLYCLSQVSTGRVFKCTMNARVGRELEFPEWPKISEPRTVAVIGAGPAGCEASRVLAERGYKVVLFDKRGYIGGSVNLANKPPHQYLLDSVMSYYNSQLVRLGVDVRLYTEATVETVKALEPYAVVVAVGAKPIVPRLEGIKNDNVYMFNDVLTGKVQLPGKKVAVIGGGLTGCETAEFIAERGYDTSVIEMASDVCPGEYCTNVDDTKIQMNKYGVKSFVSHRVEKITSQGVVTTDLLANKEETIAADSVVICVGSRPDPTVVQPFVDAFDNTLVLGDAEKMGKITDAIRSAFTQAYVL